MSAKTTLDAPFPPFDRAARLARQLPVNAVAERWYFSDNGSFRWSFSRASGLGTCCERLTKTDWNIPFRSRADDPRCPHPGLVWEWLFRDYSGSISDKHLRAYFDESELRWNARAVPPYETATELLARFAMTVPYPYRAITGPPPDASPLWVTSGGKPSRS